MSSVFTKIINGEIPSFKIGETENCFAFLDSSPLTKGHTLVIPKQEIDYIYDLDDALLTELHLYAKQVALAIQQAMPCLRIGVAVMGLEVPHAHIHLIPMNTMDDMNFSHPKLKLDEEEMKSIQTKIVNFLM